MALVYANNADVRRAVTALQKRGKLPTLVAVEEVIVDIPTSQLIRLKGWRKVTVMVRDWLQAHGYTHLADKITAWLDGNLSDQERADLFVADLVRGAREYIAGKRPRRRGGLPGDTRLSTTLAEDIERQEKWLQTEAQARGFADVEDMLAKDYPLFEKLAGLWRTKNPAEGGVMLSRRPDTKAKYEARIDELFAGDKPRSIQMGQDAALVLDASDILDLLKEGAGPVILDEAAVRKPEKGQSRGMKPRHPNMTAAQWKKVPDWLDDPAAVFNSATIEGDLVFVAPELVDGSVVLVTLDPKAQGGSRKASVRLLTNAYDKDESMPPFSNWLATGKARYINKKEFPAVLRRFGLQLPETAYQNKPGTQLILTEKNLNGYRKANYPSEGGGQADMPGTRLSIRKAAKDRAEEIIQEKSGSRAPLDVLAKGLTKITGIERLTGAIYDKAGYLLDRYTPETIKAGVVSDYGVPQAVIDQRVLLQGRQRVQLRKAGELIEKLSTLTREESRVAYEWMNMDGSDPKAYMSMMQGLAAMTTTQHAGDL
jgi:hypothetical protein